MQSKRISLTESVQREIAFSINRHINDIRLDLLKVNAKNSHYSVNQQDDQLNKLGGDLLADINSILGIIP